MDMLTNEERSHFVQLKLTKYYGSSNGYTKFSNSTPIVNINLNTKNKFLGNELFSFSEYDRVKIEFLSDNSEDKLEIESYCGIYESYTYKDEFIKELKPGESTLISPGGDMEDMLVPGSYEIKIKRGNIYYFGMYTINPSTATWNSLVNMREYVEETVKGLSYNIYMERKGKSDFSYNMNDTLMEKYRYLNEIKNIFISSLDLISKDPITSIEKVYKYCHKSKRPTNKSQRWITKKGYKYNENIHTPDTFYEKRSIMSEDTLENRILKYMLEEIHTILVNLSDECISVDKEIKKKIDEINIRIDETYNRRKGATSTRNISQRVIDSISSDLSGLKKSLVPQYDRLNQIQGYISNINRIKSNLNFYLRESWISELDNSGNCIPTTKLIKNKYYNEVYRIYECLKGSNIEGNEQKSFPYKKTSKLYEIYNFLLVKDILEEIGFKWTLGWLKDKSDILSFDGDLNSNDYIVLEYKNYKVKVIYDKLVIRSKELTIKESEESQISAKQYLRNTKPDILIEFYEYDKFLEAIIIEVKYRKLNYIHNDTENTEVDEQLENYRDLEYYDGKLKKVGRNPPIVKVIAMYPQQRHARKIVHSIYSNIVFLPIMTSENEKNIHNGYAELRNEIFETIEEYIGEEILVSTTI